MDDYGPFILDKISINDASTFYGFCSTHDNALFHCVDDFDFEPTDEQVFMLTYRTVVRELYTKSASAKSNPHIDTVVNAIPNPIIKKNMVDEVSAMNKGTLLGEKYSTKLVSEMYNSLKVKDFSKIRYLLIKTKNFSDIVTSGAFMPDYDYDDKKINNYINEDVHWVAINIFSDSKNGLILFSWIDNLKSEQFIDSLLKQDDIPNKAIELAFTNIENTYFSKKWWDSLKTIKKSRIEKMVLNWLHYDLENGQYTGIRRNNLHYSDFDIELVINNYQR